ncbi:MAG: response regulator [Elusimicrobia bacterium]|nr:response regulator [Elusimicrobiota bacterium]
MSFLIWRTSACVFERSIAMRVTVDEAELHKIALAERPDLVIIDLRMSEMSGHHIISMLDMHSDLSGIPVIITTGASRGELSGMDIPKETPVLYKPFKLAELSAEVEKIFESRS